MRINRRSVCCGHRRQWLIALLLLLCVVPLASCQSTPSQSATSMPTTTVTTAATSVGETTTSEATTTTGDGSSTAASSTAASETPTATSSVATSSETEGTTTSASGEMETTAAADDLIFGLEPAIAFGIGGGVLLLLIICIIVMVYCIVCRDGSSRDRGDSLLAGTDMRRNGSGGGTSNPYDEQLGAVSFQSAAMESGTVDPSTSNGNTGGPPPPAPTSASPDAAPSQYAQLPSAPAGNGVALPDVGGPSSPQTSAPAPPRPDAMMSPRYDNGGGEVPMPSTSSPDAAPENYAQIPANLSPGMALPDVGSNAPQASAPAPPRPDSQI